MKVETTVVINIPDKLAKKECITPEAVKRALYVALVVKEWPLMYIFEEELGIDINALTAKEEDPIEVPEGREIAKAGAR